MKCMAVAYVYNEDVFFHVLIYIREDIYDIYIYIYMNAFMLLFMSASDVYKCECMR